MIDYLTPQERLNVDKKPWFVALLGALGFTFIFSCAVSAVEKIGEGYGKPDIQLHQRVIESKDA